MLQHLDRVFDAKHSVTKGGALCGISSPCTQGGGLTHKRKCNTPTKAIWAGAESEVPRHNQGATDTRRRIYV